MTKIKEIMTSRKTEIVLLASLITVMILPFSKVDFADAKQVTDMPSLKEALKERLIILAEKDRVEQNTGIKYPEKEYGIPYNLVFENNGKTVVGIDANKAQEFGKTYSKDQVKADLGTNEDINVGYFVFERESDVRGGDVLAETDIGKKVATITVVKNNKIITTGHSYSLNQVVYAGLADGISCKEVKITKDHNYSGAYADAAYGVDTNVDGCDNSYLNDSIHHNGKKYSVTYGVANDITHNQFVRIGGALTESSGHILDTDVTIKDSHGVLNDQVVANYPSTAGDSGAPIFFITGSSSAKLLGQHVGKACSVDLHSGTNYGSWCDSNGGQGLTIFSPWDQVASHLGM